MIVGALSTVRRARGWLPALALIGAGVLAGCASSTEVQRATQGPTADEMWFTRFVQGYGRPPTFDEKIAWKDGVEARILSYLSGRPEIAASPRASQFRFQRAILVGMRKDEVLLLLEQPDAMTSDEAAMRAAAGQFWEPIGKHAKEMWTYPQGWHLYFDGDLLSDLTVAGGRPLE